MIHDPSLIKPNADYHKRTMADDRRTMADDHYDSKLKPLVLINARKPKRFVLPPRSWSIKQVIPIVQKRLAANATLAVKILNLSNLPNDSTPEHCILWVETFLESLEALKDQDDAADAADRAVSRID